MINKKDDILISEVEKIVFSHFNIHMRNNLSVILKKFSNGLTMAIYHAV